MLRNVSFHFSYKAHVRKPRELYRSWDLVFAEVV